MTGNFLTTVHLVLLTEKEMKALVQQDKGVTPFHFRNFVKFVLNFLKRFYQIVLQRKIRNDVVQHRLLGIETSLRQKNVLVSKRTLQKLVKDIDEFEEFGKHLLHVLNVFTR